MNLLQNQPNPLLHVFVCVNDRTLKNKQQKQNNPSYQCMQSCGQTITKETVKEVKSWIMQNSLTHKVLITKTKCLGVCPKTGGVIVIYGSKNKQTQKGIWHTNIKNKKDIITAIKKQLF
ncbi:(2Fe-2S) ferredoxin domain-containing protein [archaeon]|jgi:(2Fe-2S) ferredoxin|nr:(2Fe-2S) ferredoxin domain-containing protein [archaeon]MBT6698402.1 (2Fe-2S) ferredoxin domain-containing protein [archaeon]